MPATLADIRTKVRRLTRTPSTALMSDALVDQYINDFYIYDFPEHLRLFSQETTLTWYTNPNQDIYPTDTSIPNTNPLYDFQNRYVTTDRPIYIAGYESVFTQSRTEFYRLFPMIRALENVATGDGVNNVFSGKLTNVPILPGGSEGFVVFSSIDTDDLGIVVVDEKIVETNESGFLVNQATGETIGAINYLTGEWNITFNLANPIPANGKNLVAQYYPYVANRPNALLYYDNQFIVRPVPDKVYQINMQVYLTPTEMVNSTDTPFLNQWWQYLAYGAAKKIFEDRSDIESVQKILPEFEKQEMLVQRRTIVQRGTQRAATIYSSLEGIGYQWGNYYPGSY